MGREEANEPFSFPLFPLLPKKATSVNVERAFSFGRDYIGIKRHSLSATSICAGMSLAAYSRNGLVTPGLLRMGRKREREERAARAKEDQDLVKAKEAVAKRKRRVD